MFSLLDWTENIVYVYEVLGKAMEKHFVAMMPVWGVWKARDSTGNLTVGGEKALGEKAQEREESVPYISISQMLVLQNHLGDF